MPKYRRIKIFFITVFCLIYIAAYPCPDEVYRLKLFYQADVLFYVDNLPQNCGGCKVLHNGINYELKTDLINAYMIRNGIDVRYQTVIFKGDIDYVLRYLNIKRQDVARLNGGLLVSGYCPQIKGGVTKSGINIQVYAKDGTIYIGNPVIFGSF